MTSMWWLVWLLTAQAATAPRVVHYDATIANVKYVYGVAEPVARVRPGDTIETNTLDAFGNVIKKPGDTMALVKGDNPLTGPFYVEGAQPGDTLAVRVLDLEVDGTQGVGALAPGFGTLNPTNYTPMLNPDLPENASGSTTSTRRRTPPPSRPPIHASPCRDSDASVSRLPGRRAARRGSRACRSRPANGAAISIRRR